MKKKIVMMFVMALLIPYVTTLAWTGTIKGEEVERSEPSGKRVILDRGGGRSVMDGEEYLVGILAKQINPEYEEETLKAQSIIARTYLWKQLGEETQIQESALDIDYLEANQMEKIWGREKSIEYYKKIEQAVKATKGVTLKYEDTYIDPLFHQVSAGKTRSGDELHPYLKSVSCAGDLEAESYLSMFTWTREEFSRMISQIPDGAPVAADQVPESIQLIERDEAGYVAKIQIGTKAYTGEEVRFALGMPSACFSFEEYEGNIRGICKGIGHGYGFDQFGADQKAKEGWTAKEILEYFYDGAVAAGE